jgi:hypothetical protein
MIRLVLAIFARRLTWLPPFVTLVALLAITYGIPGSAMSSYAFVAMFISAFSVWVTVLVGSCDDEGHRQMVVAQLGSIRRAHTERAITTTALVAAAAVLCTLAPVVAGSLRMSAEGDPPLPSNLVILGSGFAVQFAFGLIGVGVGSFLHRPILQRTAPGALAGIGVGIALPFVPPVLAVLRHLNRNEPDRVVLLLVGAALFAMATVAAASRLAERQ